MDQGYVGLVTQFGKFNKCVNPGLVKVAIIVNMKWKNPLTLFYQVNPLTESVHRVDVKMQITEIPRQVIMTRDNVSVKIDSVLYWHIVNPYRAEFSVSNVKVALVER